MNIRDAILAAADQIQRDPESFNYFGNDLPSCGTPGCAIGWVAHFRGIRGSFNAASDRDAIRAIGVHWNYHSRSFVGRMDELSPVWRNDAAACARALRLYADKYHPAESPAVPVAYPDWMAIARGDVKCVEAP